MDVQLVFLSCWIRDSSNKRTYISSFLYFLSIDSIKYGRIPKTAKEHASSSPRALLSYRLGTYSEKSVQLMKEKWLFTMFNVKIQGCGNTEMFYLSEKSYLFGQNPTCPVFFINIWYLQTQLLTKLNLFILSITSLRKIWNIV